MNKGQAKLIQEIHEAIVGNPSGTVKGLRARTEEIEARHARLDEGGKGRKWRATILEGSRVIASAITGWIAGHGGK